MIISTQAKAPFTCLAAVSISTSCAPWVARLRKAQQRLSTPSRSPHHASIQASCLARYIASPLRANRPHAGLRSLPNSLQAMPSDLSDHA
jgi:hypothetical protein